MEVASTAWHVISSAFVFFVGAAVSLSLPRRFGVPWKRSLALYLWHTLFCLLYLAYSLNNVADSTLYYQQSLLHAGGFSTGTQFVYFFTSIFSQALGLSYLGVFLVFNIFGFVGLTAFYGAIRGAVKHGSVALKRLGFIAVLLPSASFWSAAVGKDAISFMASGLFLWAALDMNKRVGWLLFALFAMMTVRLHVAALMVVSIAVGILFARGLPRSKRVLFGLAGLLGALAIIPAAMQYAGVGSESGQDILDYVEQRQSHNMGGGSSLDISGMSPPMQLATYLYRPLPFEAHNVTALAASLENVFLLLLSAGAVVTLIRSKNRNLIMEQVPLWAYVLSTWLILAVTTANLGIAVRQKWMFLPVLLYLLFYILGHRGRKGHIQAGYQAGRHSG